MNTIILILAWTFFIFLAIQVGYLIIFSVAGSLASKTKFAKTQTFKKIRVLIPAYKEDSVIYETASAALKVNYPKEMLDVVVIADSLKEQTIAALKFLPIKVIEVEFEKSTKGKALKKAIDITRDKPADIALVLDADNHMASDFLSTINNAFAEGYKAVQGHRTAKYKNTPFALLDACTEEINNHIFRRGHVALRLPSALIGSGMAFDWKLFENLLENIGDTSGEDKELEFRLTRAGIKIAFLDGAYVYDEKVAKQDVFARQRSRWLAMQLEYFQKYFLEGWKQLFKGNIAFFNKVFQTYLIPRVLLLAVVSLYLIAAVFVSANFIIPSVLLMVTLCIALLLGIPGSWYNKNLLKALFQIPSALLGIVSSMMMIGKARKHFIHTPHGEVNHD